MKVFITITILISSASALKLQSPIPAFSSGDIIDGVDAQKGEAPFIVSLQYRDAHFCAGSIISDHWVVTAAHCLIYEQFSVIGGLYIRNNPAGSQKRLVTNKTQSIAHEKYGGNVGPNDIGLIYIEEPFNFNVNNKEDTPIGPIKLPHSNNNQNGDGTIFGWGKNRAGILPQTLQKLDTRVIGYQDCKKELPFMAPIASVNICTHHKGHNKFEGACNGDSGGPLVKYRNHGVELIGIVSWGYVPCASSTYPSVFTSTACYKDWIDNTIANYIP